MKNDLSDIVEDAQESTATVTFLSICCSGCSPVCLLAIELVGRHVHRAANSEAQTIGFLQWLCKGQLWLQSRGTFQHQWS